MEESEYRWHQRLKNFSKAWKLLKEAIDLSHTRELNELEDQGLALKTLRSMLSILFLDITKGINRVVWYGSRAKGNYKNGSDIDLTIEEQGLSYRDVLRIESLLDDLLLPHKIDLSLFRHIENPGLREHIEKTGKIFYQKDPDRIHHEINQ